MCVRMLRFLFFAVIVRFVVLIVIGLHIRRRHLLPVQGPAIIIANHNSHLDTMVLMSAMPLRLLSKVRPVAAADYFLKNKFLSWFSRRIIGIIPINRTLKHEDPFKEIDQALDDDSIIIFFPEGTRGDPESLVHAKSGIAHLAKRHQDVPVIPVFMYGLGKSLPKGDLVLVPFFCDFCVGEAIPYCEDRKAYLKHVDDVFVDLASEIPQAKHEFV